MGDVRSATTRIFVVRKAISQLGYVRSISVQHDTSGFPRKWRNIMKAPDLRGRPLALECFFQLRLVHSGTPLDTALTGFVVQLSQGSPAGPRVRAQTAAPAR